jgi:hypothetical protein
MNENTNADEPPIDEQNPNQSPEEQQENMNENENADQPPIDDQNPLHIRFLSCFLVGPVVTGLDFVHQSVVDLHFQFDSYFLDINQQCRVLKYNRLFINQWVQQYPPLVSEDIR